MLSRRIYLAASKFAFATMFFGVALGLYVVWFEPHDSQLVAKLFWTLAIIFAGSVMTMAFASVRETSQRPGPHKSFRLTQTTQQEDHDDSNPAA